MFLVTIFLISFHKINVQLGLVSYKNNDSVKGSLLVYVCIHWVFFTLIFKMLSLAVWHSSSVQRRIIWPLPSPWIVLACFTNSCGGNLGN